jgi:hypothetical protein
MCPVVLLIVLAAWFAEKSVKLPGKLQEKVDKPAVSNASADPASFGVAPGKWVPGGQCNIEFLNGVQIGADTIPVERQAPVKLVGWALDAEKARLPKLVLLRFTNAKADVFAPVQSGLRRDDVKNYFKLPDHLVSAGFEFRAHSLDIQPGVYSVTLALAFEEATYTCDSGRKIRVL